MCTGLELGLMAAGAAGNVIQASQVQKRQDAIVAASNSRLDQFLDRNKERQTQAEALFDERQKASQAEESGAARDEAVANREAKVTQAVDSTVDAATPVPTKGTAATIIGNVYAGEREKGRTAATSKAKAMAKTSGFGDALFNADMANTEIGRRIGTIGEFASSDASMLPYYQQLAEGAAAARNRPGILGPLLSSAGTAGGYYFGSRAAPGVP